MACHSTLSTCTVTVRNMVSTKRVFWAMCVVVATLLLVTHRLVERSLAPVPRSTQTSDHSWTAVQLAQMTRRGLRTERESPCPDKPLDIRVNATLRLQYVPRCHGNITLLPEEVNRTWLPSLNFGDPCLKTLIDKHCTDRLPVPNVVHHVWFGPRHFRMDHFLSFLSVKFQAPCLVLVHSDVLPSGPLWEFYLQQQQRVLHVNRSRPLSIHGNTIVRVEHQADVARLEAVTEYGGIYMDTDTVLLRSLESFRFLPMTLSFAVREVLSNGLIIAAPRTPFLSLWHASYKTFKAQEWGQHSVIMTAKIAREHPHLITTVFRKFIGPSWQNMSFYNGEGRQYDWSSDFAIHLYTRLDPRRQLYNVSSVLWMDNTVASVARHVLYGRTKPCPPPPVPAS